MQGIYFVVHLRMVYQSILNHWEQTTILQQPIFINSGTDAFTGYGPTNSQLCNQKRLHINNQKLHLSIGSNSRGRTVRRRKTSNRLHKLMLPPCKHVKMFVRDCQNQTLS